jgi:5-methylcytosine-specific restriction endonuclease McrA
MRCCGACRESFPLETFGWKDRAAGKRLAACPPCLAARQRRYYAANPDRVKARTYQWNKANRETFNAVHRNYIAGSEEQRRKKAARDYAWARANPTKIAGYMQRRRAAKRVSEVAPVDRAAIIVRDGGICYLCGSKPTGRNLTLDHVIPLALGGPHVAWNLRVACRSCNGRKGARQVA